MKIDVSDGEILDKISILQIKSKKITDKNKLSNIHKELNYLLDICNDLFKYIDISKLYNQLFDTNNKLWEVEDKIREKERQKLFDQEFIHLARQVYFTNDLRSEIKKQINITTQSNFIEEKSYEKY